MGRRVEVYYNFRDKCLSWRRMPYTNSGVRMLASAVRHTEAIGLQNVTFVVQPAGRAKVLREKRKNVHAFVRGDFISASPIPVGNREISRLLHQGYIPITYNPYKYDSFVIVDHEIPVKKAEGVIISGNKIYARGLS